MLTLVDTLRKYGHDSAVRQRSLDLIERGLKGIRNVVRATLATYKGLPQTGPLSPGDLDDLRFLIQHEVARRHLRLAWQNGLLETLNVDGRAIRQIALNLLLNACAASPEGGLVRFEARIEKDKLSIVCADEGPGLPPDVERLLREPRLSAALPSGSVGLGVWTICQLLARHHGRVAIERPRAGGTCIAVDLPLAPGVRADAEEEKLNAVA
jgi:signal transduction histidine kinase